MAVFVVSQAGVRIGDVNGKGLRGVIAKRNFKEGETIISIPDRLAVGLASHEYTAAVRATTPIRKQILDRIQYMQRQSSPVSHYYL